jgi:type IV pilus assembly protein PilE
MRGFSLAELLVVVAIVGILAGLATTAYERHALHAQRVLAYHHLLTIAHAQERYRSTHQHYAGTLVALGVAGAASDPYRITVESPAPLAFLARATPTGRQQRDACGALWIDHLGQKHAEPASVPARACW